MTAFQRRLLLLACVAAVRLFSQERSSPPGAMLPGLTGAERELFRKGREAFTIPNSVQGDAVIPATEAGLGPAFNLDSCAGCRARPARGGSSPPANPQLAAAAREGARNSIPFFIKSDGPALQVRFRFLPDGTRDGSVHALFTIAGRRDAGECSLAQPDFGTEQQRNNLSFRIPTPLYGAGLLEAIPESEILANQRANAAEKKLFGIAGRPNRDPRDGGVTRFGWKAQNRSLDLFVAEAYLIEQGVTNEFFPEEYGNPPAPCLLNSTPEDRKILFARRPADAYSNVTRIAHFLRFLAPPAPAAETADIARGKAIFAQIGCALCHTPGLRTGRSSHPALAEKPVALYSDLLLHRMGAGLADEILQNEALAGEFRTAPLWGLGDRRFFLHDGRTSDLVEAILAHASKKTARYGASEANGSVKRFRSLTSADRNRVLSFLLSL